MTAPRCTPTRHVFTQTPPRDASGRATYPHQIPCECGSHQRTALLIDEGRRVQLFVSEV